MVESSRESSAPLAELGWNLAALRRVRVRKVVVCVGDGVLFLAALFLLPGLWRWLAVPFGGLLAVDAWVTRLLFGLDMPRRLQVYDAGLHLETERGEAGFGWDEVEGFTGVAQRRPSPTAPRTTTGSLSRSPTLWAAGKQIPLEGPATGDVQEVTRLIEERLLAGAAMEGGRGLVS